MNYSSELLPSPNIIHIESVAHTIFKLGEKTTRQPYCYTRNNWIEILK
jgi:hypothetical protein